MTALNAVVLLSALAGHLALTVLLVNVSHGSGLVTPWLNRLTLVFLAASGLASLAGLWWLWGQPFAAWPLALQLYGGVCLAIGLVGLPADAVRRLLRRTPAGVVVRSEVLDLAHPPDGGPPPIGNGLGGLLLRVPGNESLFVRVLDFTVTLEGLPERLDGLSVVHLSDFHFTRAYQRRFFDLAMDAAADFEPDLVLFTGDLIDDDACIPWIEPVFRRLHGRLGSFAILGNHDHLSGHERIVAMLEHAGFEILEGRWTRIDRDGASLTLGGTSAPWGRDPDPAARPEADLSLLLSHTPDRLYRVATWGVDLMFSGHNHGGQVRLPLIGPVLMPSRFGRRFDAGFFRQGRTLLYVSHGLGAEHPIRYRCMPEITHLTFRSPARIAHAAAGSETTARAAIDAADHGRVA